MSYHSLPEAKRFNGELRRVGFELEFTGIDFESAGKALQKSVDGELKKISEVVWVLASPTLGDFKIELDWSALKESAENESDEELKHKWISFLRDSASLVVPLEVVFPPLNINQLSECDRIIENFRNAGARGSEGSAIAAYGVHINTELPDLNLPTVVNYLRAFSLLQWWLVDANKADLTRRISPYVDLYSEKYVRRIVTGDPDNMPVLIDDYLAFNATRNRALDMLPVFSVIDQERVTRSIDDDRIKPRETFHYRLPNCEIDKPGWQLCSAWNIWLLVEKLANDTEALAELGKEFLDRHRPLLGVKRKKWVHYLNQWIQDRKWV